MHLSIPEIIDHTLQRYPGLVQNHNWGELGLFYNPERKLSKGIYLLTFKEKDGPNDHASKLDRGGLYRLNLGIGRHTFIDLFGEVPKRPSAGNIIDMPYDFTQTNIITPHPVYGWMAWISVINPGGDTFGRLQPLIEEGYLMAVRKYARKKLQ